MTHNSNFCLIFSDENTFYGLRETFKSKGVYLQRCANFLEVYEKVAKHPKIILFVLPEISSADITELISAATFAENFEVKFSLIHPNCKEFPQTFNDLKRSPYFIFSGQKIEDNFFEILNDRPFVPAFPEMCSDDFFDRVC